MNLWNQIPLLRLILPFILGILTAIYYPFDSGYTYYLLAFLIIFLSLIHRFWSGNYQYRWVFGVLFNLLVFTVAYQYTVLKTANFSPYHYGHYYQKGDQIIAKVIEPPIEKSKTLKVILKIIALKAKDNEKVTEGKVLAYFPKDSLSKTLKYHDLLIINSSLIPTQPPQNPAEFNYKQSLRFHQIYNQLFVKTNNYKLLQKNNDFSIKSWFYDWRIYFLSVLKKYELTGDDFAVASALILGYRNDLDPELIRAYSSAGAMHVLAVSGLHVGIIFWLVSSLLKFLEKNKNGKFLKAFFVILILWIYAGITGMSASVTRATTMFTFVVLGTTWKRNSNIYNTLCVSALVMLLWDPYFIMQVGFQLSYLAVLGIVYIQPRLYNLWQSNFRVLGIWGNTILDKIWVLCCVSIAAQIATFPLGVLYFYQFPNYFLISNLLVIPLATLILSIGVLLLVIGQFEWLGNIIAMVFKFLVKALNIAIYWVEQLPNAMWQGISISIIETWMIYTIIIMLLLFIAIRRSQYLFLAMGLAIFLLGCQLIETFQQQNQRKIIIYKTGKSTAIDFIDGQYNFFLVDSNLYTNEDRMLFHIKHNWWDLGLKENFILDRTGGQSIQEDQLLIKNGYAQFYDKRVVVLNNDNLPEKNLVITLKVDYLIFTNDIRVHLEKLITQIRPANLIVDASHSRWKLKKWKLICDENNINFISIEEEGALEVPI